MGNGLICFDFSCHGESPETEESFSVENCMNDLLFMAELCRREYPDKEKYIFATSFGGFITLLCAKQLRDFKICMRAPAVTMPEHILLDILQVTEEEFKERDIIQCGFDRPIMLPYRFYKELKEYSVFNQTYENEMLIIQGDSDDVVPPADVREFCRLHKNMHLEVIPGADHRFKKEGELEKVIEKAINFFET